MPTFTNPRWVHVEPRSGAPVIALVVLGVMAWSGYELVQWLASIMVAIVTVLATVAAGSAATLAVVLYRHRGRTHLDAPQWVTQRCNAACTASHQELPTRPAPAITAPPRAAIAPVVHYHLHLHAAPAAQPAIEDD